MDAPQLGLENCPSFVYNRLPFPADGTFVRLIELLPAPAPDADVTCNLHEVAFDDSTQDYETLSYCWGSTIETRTITCNGLQLQVTETLHDALKALRLPDTPRTLWADQICINQKDNEEKTAQVGFMRNIYQRSSLTVAWLGHATDSTDAAIRAAHRIAIAATSDKFAEERNTDFDGPWSERLRILLVERSGGWGEVKPSPAESRAMSVLLRKPWFSRMWIIQEVGVSDRVTLLCGGSSIDLDLLIWGVALASLARVEGTGSAGFSRLQQLVFLNNVRHLQASGEPFSLPDLLEAAQLFDATDPRDKLYALYGLTSSNLAALGLMTDYTLPADWVYSRTFHTLIRHDGNLRLLEFVDKQSEQLHLPSWVPNLVIYWPLVGALSRARSWDQIMIGPRLRRAALRALVEDRGYLEGSSEREREEWIEKVDAGIEDSDDNADSGMHQPPQFAAAANSPLTTLDLEASGALRISGQLVDKVGQGSSVLDSRMLEADDFYPDAMEIPDVTVGEVVRAFGTAFQNVYRKVKEYLRTIGERHELVMARKNISYPTGESILTVYRKTITADSRMLSEDEAEKLFMEWLNIFKPIDLMARIRDALGVKHVAGGLTVLNLLLSEQLVSRRTKVFFVMTEVSNGRRLAWTEKGYLALLPAGADCGDLIILLRGGRFPFVVRPSEHGHYRLIGHAYVHGIMFGEAFDEDLCGDIRLA